MRTTRKRNHNKAIVVTAIFLVVAAVAVAAVYRFNHKDDIERDANGISTGQTPQDRKLEEELKNNPDLKEQSAQTDHPTSPDKNPETQLQTVNVVLTNAGESGNAISASGFVTNTVESNGTCTYVFTKGSVVVKKITTTLQNATSTTCKTLSFNSDELTAGVWKVQLEYSSNESSGKSNTVEITVS